MDLLTPRELSDLWQRVPEGRRLAFLSTLVEPAADSLLSAMRGEHEQRDGRQRRRRREGLELPDDLS